ncbi:MAG: Crp/Fnr family transcriptional regulator [Acidimicrobiales bacterium]
MEWKLLDALAPPDRQRLMDSCDRRHFGRRQELFGHGDRSDGMHLVVQGRVIVRMGTPAGDYATLSVVGPQEIVGEQSLLAGDARRSASALALDPVETLYLSRDAFERLRTRHPSVDRFLIGLLTARVLRLSDQLVEALFVPAHQRVLRRVVDAAGAYRRDRVPLTQEDIATMAGSTRPTVNRVLRRAEEAGMLRLGRGHLQILDPRALHALAYG